MTKVVPKNHSPLVIRFFEILRDSERPMQSVTRASGLATGTLNNWRRVNPGVTNFQAALNALGYELVIRKLDADG